MYDDFYGLSGKPFQLTPDPAFWYDTGTHRKAMAYLTYGLSEGEGFIVITGDPGAGKTTLLGHVLSTIDPARLNVIRLVTTQLEPEDLLQVIANGLGTDATGLSKAQLLSAIERGLHAVARAGRRTLLVVDEAQSLPLSALEELRMLSNFQAGGHALLQIFLLGQPEFRERLQGSGRVEQLRQRVIAMHHLDPMEAHEVEPYIVHRLSLVGWNGRPDFTPEAIDALYRWSGGVPRRLNLLMGRVLLLGGVEEIERLDVAEIESVTSELDDDVGVPEDAEITPAYDAGRTVRGTLHAVPPVTFGVQSAELAALNDRIAKLEARLADQDETLRRVLMLLVDWVEGEERRPNLDRLRGTAA
ncbi:AAA family ATPase [Sphingomonas sp. PL-96]|uniref:AAA family ATPase n=1 Tax=Sphingomonas sp. PL-96 TaxID=2887201 RepID=UPI001E3BC046|nr:AAA family ATPase [Sphingomonas sp. PL-96]MCC2975605.1 AAA family ATPase [Sphingomonas sp. PL-96]